MGRRLPIRSNRRIVPAGNAWSPLSLGSALEGWWRADRGVTEVAGVASQWDDLSGHGRHFTQSSALLRPTYNLTGGPGNGPYLSSDAIVNCAMNITLGDPATSKLNSYSLFILTAQFTGVVNNVYFTTLTSPAGTSILRLRRNISGDMGVDQPTTSAPAIIHLSDPDMLPTGQWMAFGTSITSARERSVIGWAEGTEGTTSDGVHANIGAVLGEGRIFQNATGTTTSYIGIAELAIVSTEATLESLVLWRNYWRSRGIDT